MAHPVLAPERLHELAEQLTRTVYRLQRATAVEAVGRHCASLLAGEAEMGIADEALADLLRWTAEGVLGGALRRPDIKEEQAREGLTSAWLGIAARWQDIRAGQWNPSGDWADGAETFSRAVAGTAKKK